MSRKIEEELKNWFADAKKVVVAGIGNPIRMDDFVGIKIVQGLQGKVSEKVCLLECETVPESFQSEIEEFHPTHVLLVDAAFLSKKPGEVSLVDAEEIASFPAVTSHVLPLRVFCDFVKQTSGAKVGLLLVEPKCMEFGEGLSAEVEASAKILVDVLAGLLGKL